MNRPHPKGDERTHLMLLRTMAAETGADMAMGYEEGTLTQDAWHAAIERCRDCRWTEGCRRFLATPEARPRAVPPACANAGLLREMRLR